MKTFAITSLLAAAFAIPAEEHQPPALEHPEEAAHEPAPYAPEEAHNEEQAYEAPAKEDSYEHEEEHDEEEEEYVPEHPEEEKEYEPEHPEEHSEEHAPEHVEEYAPEHPEKHEEVPAHAPEAPAKPAPHHYPEPAQKECGILYTDVLEQLLQTLLAHIDPAILEQVMALVHQLLEHVKSMENSAESVMEVVAAAHEVKAYCEEHLGEEEKAKVVETVSKAAEHLEHIYEAPVDEPVAKAFEGLWEKCKASAPEYIEKFHGCYSSYLEAGGEADGYKAPVEDMKADEEHPEIAAAAEEVDHKIKTLEANEEAPAELASGATKMAVGGVVMVAAILF